MTWLKEQTTTHQLQQTTSCPSPPQQATTRPLFRDKDGLPSIPVLPNDDTHDASAVSREPAGPLAEGGAAGGLKRLHPHATSGRSLSTRGSYWRPEPWEGGRYWRPPEASASGGHTLLEINGQYNKSDNIFQTSAPQPNMQETGVLKPHTTSETKGLQGNFTLEINNT